MTIRVVQWGSGNVGQHVIRTLVEQPDMDLVGLMVTNPAKAGLDVGDIVGLPSTGVLATDDLDEILAVEADVVLHMPLPSLVHGDDPDADLDNFCTLLASGKHVVTTVGYMYPKVYGDGVMDRLTEACRIGGSTFHGTGANPGWFGDLLPLLMSGLSLRIDRIDVQEISNFQHYPSPEIMFEMMNFGLTPPQFEDNSARHRRWLDGLFTEAVQMVADGIGVSTTGTNSQVETWVTDRDLDTAAGCVPAGTVAGQRYRWDAVVDDVPFVSQETVWRMHSTAAPDWPVGDWSVRIVGEPEMNIELKHGWNRNVLASTGAHAINAVPYLMDADPGVVTFLDLPIVAGRGALTGVGRTR
ncbi:dihydrodipicolinate reductase [Ilumatobacter sp.]|uniref:NAD(P)H-dependent amine dehydrogenase family protein n=1 Tax=Ilumatobacter sp. TaxID=1967498 RepID=UPI003C47D9AD